LLKVLIRDELVSADVIKTVDNSFEANYNGSADKLTYVSTDHNEKWREVHGVDSRLLILCYLSFLKM